MGFSVLLTFAIEYAFYPGVILEIIPTFFTKDNNDMSWFVITMITYHSLFDTLGRYLAGKFNIIRKEIFFWVCLSRLIFVLTYLLSYYGVAGSFFRSNWFIMLNLTLFSISCGYLSTLGMEYGSDSTTLN